MCKFKSAIVMRNGDLLHHESLTSHEDLIDFFNINDSHACCDKFVRVEFTPDDKLNLADISKYILRVDESVVPDWFDKYRNAIQQKLTEIVSKRIISGSHKLLTGGLYVVKDAQINRLQQAIVVLMQNSSVRTMWNNSSVGDMWNNSSVGEMRNNSSVRTMWNNSSVGDMWDNSSVGDMWDNSSVGDMRDNSSVRTMQDNSSVRTMWNNSSVRTMQDNSSVVDMWDNSSVGEMRNNSKTTKS